MEYRLKAKLIGYDIKPIDINNLPATTLTKIHPDGNVVCSSCGVKATHQGMWRHIKEKEDARHSSYFYPIREENGVVVLFYMTVDHIFPRSLGGGDRLTNYRAMCYECNQARQNRMTNLEILEVLTNPLAYTTHLRVVGLTKDPLTHKPKKHPLAGWYNILKKFPILENSVVFT